ncbi:MAG: hypothetical protein RL885_28695 [Planctomycetota bacterium]
MTARTTAQSGSVLNIALILGLLVMVAIGVVGILWAAEKIELPALDKLVGKEKPKENLLEGKVPVPVAARFIPAYEKVSKDDLWDLQRQTIKFVYLTAPVGGGIVKNASDILNRVLRKDKEPGYVFFESDFLPKGTRPGITAGIPPGKVSHRVSADKIHGLHGLNPQDRFFLIATYPLEDERETPFSQLPLQGAQKLLAEVQDRSNNASNKARVEIIVRDGYVVTAVQTRNSTKTVNTLTSGKVTRNSPVQEMVIALDPQESVKLAEALALKAEITCSALSGNADSPEIELPDTTPRNDSKGNSLLDQMWGTPSGEDSEGKDPVELDYKIIDTIEGGKTKTEVVPRKKKSTSRPK